MVRPVVLPMDRDRPFDPPPELARFRSDGPLTRMVFPNGRLGWLVTDHGTARFVLADGRFSNRQELRDIPIPHPQALERPGPAVPGFFLLMDPPGHTRYRRMLGGYFTGRSARRLRSRIERITDDHLDAMARKGPPAELVEDYALPIPSLVICELLGVPGADRAHFQLLTRTALHLKATADQIENAFGELAGYLHRLVLVRRDRPGEGDILSDLARRDLADEELVNIASLLLIAGHESTANMLALATFTLLVHPRQRAVLSEDPASIGNAVEELLRYLSIIQFGTVRVAGEDIEVDGVVVREGENVVVSFPAANRDPARFPDPDTLDLRRSAAGHMAFGHGIHQCLGQQLARVELQVGLSRLFGRFPGLSLVVRPDEVRMRSDMEIYGVHELPVTW